MRKKRNTNAVVEVEEDKAEGSDDDVEQLGGREVRGGSIKIEGFKGRMIRSRSIKIRNLPVIDR